jgi:two-component system, response regulator FlrC
MIAMSRAAAAAHPTLALCLEQAGLGCTMIDTGAERAPTPAILGSEDAAAARPGDLIVAATDLEPSLVFGETGVARLSFGPDDKDFGLALAVELVRPAERPAAADPLSLRALDFARRIAPSDASVLVLGETGTGKEGIARYIHACSPRANKGFIAINCAALPETMLEAILFGHRRGSFTGAAGDGEGIFRAASGGTLLLDEIAEIPLALQAKLLRALQEREVLPVGATRPEAVDVRVIACANRDLAGEVAAGRFRADLYWRLNVVPVELRPLRERRRDIPAIAAALLLRHAGRREPFPFPTAEALAALTAHDWPGNARELDNVIQRALLLRAGRRLQRNDLIIDQSAPAESGFVSRLGDVARAAEARSIRAALAETGGHRVRAAARLGISERTLRYRLAEMRAA